ncbi:MAG: hypothetical protein IJY84_07025, partial [Clostridia bacterium]|nr:hypothetical protein [Clostridia bacterium]
MKKRKLILSILAATATLAMASVATGCKLKEWYEQKTCDHSYDGGVETIEPTCTQEGEITFTCEDCGHTYTESEPMLEHAWDDGEVTTSPTCTETGIKTYTCTSEDCTATKTEIMPVAEHTAKTIAAIPATCTTVGYTAWEKCEDCNAVLVPKKEIAALGHTEVADKAVAATCTTAGKTAGSHCGTCGETLTAQKVVQALGHTPVTVAGKSPTCTETGLTSGSECETCGEVFTAQEEIPVVDHTEVIDSAVAATCAETGLTEGKHCSVCNEVLVAQEVVAKTNTHVDENSDSTCEVCGGIDFAFYQDTANYIAESYTAWSALDGEVARLHVATTTADGTVTDNRFTWVTAGNYMFTYNRENDEFDYIVTGFVEMDGFGNLTHNDIQYHAFTVDGEWYVDVYFTNDIKINYLAGFRDAEMTESAYEEYGWGVVNFADDNA